MSIKLITSSRKTSIPNSLHYMQDIFNPPVHNIIIAPSFILRHLCINVK